MRRSDDSIQSGQLTQRFGLFGQSPPIKQLKFSRFCGASQSIQSAELSISLQSSSYTSSIETTAAPLLSKPLQIVEDYELELRVRDVSIARKFA